MGLFSRHSERDHAATQQVNDTLDRVMALHPHLRLARRYHARLAPAITTALNYMEDLVAALPASRKASAAAWASDPWIRAFFVNADEVAEVISRSADLRAYFERNPHLTEAYAVLGMEMNERHILGVSLEGDTMRRDVPQTTMNFGDHQVRICGSTEAELKNEIVRRLLDQLALEGLQQVADKKSRRDVLEKEQALLKTRLLLLQRQGTGLGGMFGGGDAGKPDPLAQLQGEIEENAQNLASLGLRTDALDHELDTVRDVFADPQKHIYLSRRHVKLDRNNVVLEETSAQSGTSIEFHFARIPATPPRTRAFALVQFAHADLLPAKSMLDEAARLFAPGTLT